MICTDIPAPTYLIFSDSVPALLYYSHIPTALLTILIGTVVLLADKKNLANRLLFAMSLLFFIIVFLNLVVWTNVNTGFISISWLLVQFIYLLLPIISLYFFFVFIFKKDIGFHYKLIGFLVILFHLLITFSGQTVDSFNLTYCEVTDKHFLKVYEIIILVITLIAFISGFVTKYIQLKGSNVERKNLILFSTGIISFLLLMVTTWQIAGMIENFELEQYSLFGMTFFIGVLAFLIVKYKAFNIKLIGAQALVVSLWFLVGSLLFVAKSDTTRIIAGITLLITTIAGYYLVKSVKKEVALREQIEELAGDLAKANIRLKELDKMKSEFVSIASHQLRSPLTSIRGYASMLTEGSYGKLAPKAQEILDKIADSAKFMALSIEDYLNVSRIEAGNMKYEMSDFNLKELTEKVVDEMRPVAMKKGLVMVFRSDCTSGITHADIGKTRQIIMNLLDNSMKYTPKGTITVVASDDLKKKKVRITIQDTGVGMSEETQEEVFEKFVRAKNANNVNVTGTGLGLFVAKKMIEEMAGRVWAESEGEGKGSTFCIELPLLVGKTVR